MLGDHTAISCILSCRGAHIDVRNKKGNTPLWLAANGGHFDVVQLLVQAGADVDAADNRKITPLMAAFRKVGWTRGYWFHEYAVRCINVTFLNSEQEQFWLFLFWFFLGACESGPVFSEGGESVPLWHWVHEIHRHHCRQGMDWNKFLEQTG